MHQKKHISTGIGLDSGHILKKRMVAIFLIENETRTVKLVCAICL